MTNEHDWHIELVHMKEQLRFALSNLDSISKRNDVKGKLENVYFTLVAINNRSK